MLPSGYACALAEAPRTPISTALHALTLLTHQRLAMDVELYADTVELIVLPPPCPLRVSSADFGRARELIAAAYVGTHAWLADNGGRRRHPAAGIAVHSHTTAERAIGQPGG